MCIKLESQQVLQCSIKIKLKMSDFHSFFNKIGDGSGELTDETLQRLSSWTNVAIANFTEKPQKSFDELMENEGIYSHATEFGLLFSKYLEIEVKIVENPAALTDEERRFYDQVWPVLDQLDHLVKERKEFLEFQKKHPGVHQQTPTLEQSDFNLDELINLSSRLTQTKSPLQLLDNVITEVKNTTLHNLNPNSTNSSEFFGTFGALNDNTQLNDITMSGLLQETILNASIAIELSLVGHGNFESNEAREACESYLTALALTEVEQKITTSDQRADDEAKAEVAAVSTFSSMIDEEINGAGGPKETDAASQSQPHLDFDIQDLSYEISLLPTDDPDGYKPLEIVSYVGLTRNHRAA